MKDDVIKCGLDRGLAKDRERWKVQVTGKTSELCHKGRKARRERESKEYMKNGIHSCTWHILTVTLLYWTTAMIIV